MGSMAEKKYNAAKALQVMGYSTEKASKALGVSAMTISRYYKASSFEAYKVTNKQNREKLEARKAKQQELDLKEQPKSNEIVMSRLELLGTPHEISLLAQIARKMGVMGKYTANSK